MSHGKICLCLVVEFPHGWNSSKFVYADVAKLANASDLSSDGLCTLWIQIPPSAPMGNTELKSVVGYIVRLGWV